MLPGRVTRKECSRIVKRTRARRAAPNSPKTGRSGNLVPRERGQAENSGLRALASVFRKKVHFYYD